MGWLARASQGNVIPLTRQYLACDEEDWRNLAVFSFDIAMVVRGISHTLSQQLSPLAYPLLKRYVAYLLELCDSNGHLLPFRLRDGWTGRSLPDTWSTQEGIHQLKIAAAILSIPPMLAPVQLSQVAERLYLRWADCSWDEIRATPFHPVFYFLEGLLFHSICGYDPEGIGKVVGIYERIMELQDSSGYLPAGPGVGPAPCRSDVIAQALRIGSVLRRFGHLSGARWDAKLRGLANALLDFVSTQGAVSQYPIRAPYMQCWNAWCSMFAYQALLLYAAVAGRKQLVADQALFRLLV